MDEENDTEIGFIDGADKFKSENQLTFDDIFKTVGESGPFQWLVFLGFCVLEAAGSSILVFFILDGANPGWNCPGNVGNLSSPDVANLTVNQTVQPLLLKGVCYQGKPCINFTFNEDYTSTITEWTLICDRAFISKSITSIFFVGVLIGAALAGQLSDLFGRKTALLVVWAVAMIGQICSGFSPNWPVYTAIRVITGLASGGLVTVTTVLMSEYLGPKWRTIAICRYGWSIGPLFLSVVGYFIRDWRKLSLAIGLWTSPFYPIAIIFLPESARWLMQKQRFEEAEKWIKRMAKLNKKPCPDLSVLERIAEYEDEQRQHRQKYTYLDLFYSKTLAVQSICVMFGWFSASLIALGRRKSFPFYMGTNFICMAAVLILDILGVDESRLSQTIIALIASITNPGAWAVVVLYSAELYPTLMRNISSGAGNMASRIGSIIGPQIALLGIYQVSVPYAVYGIIALVSCIVLYVVLPETKGRPLPEDFPPRKRRNKPKKETFELPSS
ncbi:solute carrier family 22 member 15-like isoform X2 [Tubulanus polymorphus]|uniref:solute carrier family 22 member 15-like isoform X2 n=1 Tax=Tubulanus polymorphus TaxID=672921 RepID=UPI003DA68F05